MKDVTVLASTTNSVTIVVNSTNAYRLADAYELFVRTQWETQTIVGPNFRAFENVCWRMGVSVADSR